MNVNVNGIYRKAVPYVNINGVWRKARSYVDVNGIWREADKQKSDYLDPSRIKYFRMVYKPATWLRYPDYNLEFNDKLFNIIDITGHDPDTINTDPKSLIFRFLEDDKTSYGIYGLEGILYAVADGVSYPVSNVMNSIGAPDQVDLKVDTSYSTESNGPYVMGWNRLFHIRENILPIYEKNLHDEAEWIDPNASARLFMRGQSLIEEVDYRYEPPFIYIDNNGELILEDDGSKPANDLKKYHFRLEPSEDGPYLIMTVDVGDGSDSYQYERGYFKNIIYSGRHNMLPSYKRSEDYDIIALVGIAREMNSRRRHMIGTHGLFSHNFNGIWLNDKLMPFSVEVDLN